MLILNRQATAAALSHGDCITALEPAMVSVSHGGAELPLRSYLNIPGTRGKFTLMPGFLAEPRTFGVKIVSKFPRPPESPLSSHVGAVMVFDADMGLPLALLDGAELTAIRTAAASALATRVLAREDASTLGILGCGEEAWHHALAIPEVRKISRILVWGRSSDRVQRFVKRVAAQLPHISVAPAEREALVAKADIICTVTSAVEPILHGAWLKPGCHVNLVGAAIHTAKEADADVVTRSKFFTDFRPSAMAQAGELLDAIAAGLVDESHILAEIGELLADEAPGRSAASDITVYKSLGVAAQDLAAGLAAYQHAKARDLGIEVEW
jgi:ornithine cyclodeaminase